MPDPHPILRAAAVLVAVLTIGSPAAAQNQTWRGVPIDNEFSNGLNWSPGNTVPTGTGFFAVSIVTALQNTGNLNMGGITLDPGAGAYTLANSGNVQLLGGGIQINGGSLAITNSNFLAFAVGATAGTATIVNSGTLVFATGATAGTADITNSNLLQFNDATAGGATITTAAGGVTQFIGSGSGGTARFIMTGGTLDLTLLAAVSVTAGSIEGAGAVSLGVATLAVGGNGLSTTYTGTIGGTGGNLEKVGAGTLVLGGVISGAGGLAAQAGTTILTASNSYTGGTTIAAGARLQIGNGANAGAIVGDVVNNGTLAFNRTGFLEMSGAISGGGALEKGVGGILVLTGANTYSGGTTINAGLLQIGNGGTTGAIVGNVAVNGAGLLLFNRSDAHTFAGAITGTGGLVQAGSGTTILTGASSFTGGTTIEAGTLQIGNGGTTGAIVGDVTNGGTLAFHRSDSITFAGVVADPSEGAGGYLVQMGPGTLILTANHAYTGTTTVAGGTLIVNGSIASSGLLTVNAGATVGGTGTLPTAVIDGTLAPGNSPGTITVAGNLTLGAGATYLVEVQGPVADRTNVTGTASLAGTLRLVPLGGAYLFNAPYTLLSAAGGRTGTFTTIDSLFGPSIRTAVTYDANSVFLTLSPGTIGVAGLTINQRSVATGFNNAVLGGADASPFFALYNLPAAALPQALDQLGGEVHTARIALGFEVSDQFLRVMLDPFALGRAPGSNPALAYAPAEALTGLPGLVAGTQAADLPAAAEPAFDTRRFALWAAAFGTDSRVRGESAVIGSHTLDSRTANLAVGADWRVGPGSVVGIAAAGGSADASVAGLGSLSAEVGQAGAYVMTRFGGLNVGAAIAYAALDIDSRRNVPVLAATSLTAGYTVHTVFGRVEASFEAARLAGVTLAPLAAFQAHAIRSPGFAETAGPGGAAAAALAVRGETQHISRAELGLRVDGVTRFEAIEVTTFARLAWARYFDRDNTFVAAFTGLPGSTFSIIGARLDRNSALVSAGIDLRFTAALSLAARFDGEFADNVTRYAGTARLRLSF